MRESMQYDIIIVGAGPAGLSAAIRLKQLCQQNKQALSICILEKGAEVGSQILSGAALEPRSLYELFPNWMELAAPLHTPILEDQFLFLTPHQSFKLPTPSPMKNHGNYIISLENFCRWLAKQAENLGVEIYPSFAATEVLYDESGAVKGVTTGDKGISKTGEHKPNYQPGIELYAKQTLFAEGCHGSLTKTLMKKFDLRRHCDPQTYGIGIKELWEVDNTHHKPGLVIHSVGWPLDSKTYGGSFLYHLKDHRQIAVGMVIGLDYQNPYLNPFEEFQRFKTHPRIKPYFSKGTRLCYGARALTEGGLQSIPKLTFPGGLLIGDSAGFLNVPKIKGTHTAMKSGMLAAEAIFEHITHSQIEKEVKSYSEKIRQSWLYEELYKVRNIRPGFRYGLLSGLLYAGLDTYILRGKAPWTFHNHADHKTLKPANQSKKIAYPKPDGILTFDKLSSVYLSNISYEENQPCHLKLKDPSLATTVNLAIYGGLEQKYCPAGVYEFLERHGEPYLQINAANCVFCKTCDIKDPRQNINWVPPEGGNGPNYVGM